MMLLQTGTCQDYSFVLTTLNRRTGYHNLDQGDLVLSTDNNVHTYNFIWLDVYGKWVVSNYGKFYPSDTEDLHQCTTDAQRCYNEYEEFYCSSSWKQDHLSGCENG